MANRQIIPLNRVVKSHVNSLDNGTGYEAGTAYEAGTLVTYNGNSYTAIVDIEDTDTDAPDEAPDKWALTPDAFTSYASDPSLAGRVSDLETAMQTKMGVIEHTQSVNIFDLIALDEDHIIHIGYADKFTDGTDSLSTLLGISVYSRVELVKYSYWYQNLVITGIEMTGNAYIAPETDIKVLKCTSSGNVIVTIPYVAP